MMDGEEVAGAIEYYDHSFIRLTRDGEPNLFIFKHDIKYIAGRGLSPQCSLSKKPVEIAREAGAVPCSVTTPSSRGTRRRASSTLSPSPIAPPKS